MSKQKKTRLTKKFLMEQKQGSYITSNICTDERMPIFAEKITSPEKRQAQWERIKKVGADNRLCRVLTGRLGREASRCMYYIREFKRIQKQYDDLRQGRQN